MIWQDIVPWIAGVVVAGIILLMGMEDRREHKQWRDEDEKKRRGE